MDKNDPTYEEIVNASLVLEIKDEMLETFAKLLETHGPDPEILNILCAANMLFIKNIEDLSKFPLRQLLFESLKSNLENEPFKQ